MYLVLQSKLVNTYKRASHQPCPVLCFELLSQVTSLSLMVTTIQKKKAVTTEDRNSSAFIYLYDNVTVVGSNIVRRE